MKFSIRSIRQFTWAAVFTVCIGYAGLTASEADPPTETPPAVADPQDTEQPPAVTEQMLREIEALRRRIYRDQGMEPIQPVVPPTGEEQSDDDSFAEALRRHVGVGGTIQEEKIPPSTGSVGPMEEFVASPPAELTLPLVAELRHTARLLDEQADRLEPTGQYRRADQLRRLADRLRAEARAEAALNE